MASNRLPGSARVTYSTQKSGFENANAFTNFRSEVWKPTGNFEIDTSNNKLYFNDGAAQTATLTSGSYTASTLATEIQTQLNAASSNFTASYSTTTYKFTLSRSSGSFELTLSSTSNACWDTIGFVTSSDLTGATSYVSEEQRNHYPHEWVKYDGGGSESMGFVGIIGDLSQTIQISGSATVTIEANTIDSWASPAYTKTLTRFTNGAFKFLDDAASSYRWWRLTIADKTNPLGPEFSIGHIYLGPYSNLTYNIQSGFVHFLQDPSQVARTDGGQIYVDTKTKYFSFSNVNLLRLEPTDKKVIDDIYETVGIHSPFFISFDPRVAISNNLDELTKFVRFTSPPRYTHAKYNQFNVTLNLEEVV